MNTGILRTLQFSNEKCIQLNVSPLRLYLIVGCVHLPELLPWSSRCYGQQLILLYAIGTISLEMGVQQGDPL